MSAAHHQHHGIIATSVEKQYATAAYSSGYVQAKANRQLYDEYYHFSFMQTVRRIVEEMEREVDGRRACAILDLGAGDAVLARRIARECPRVVCTGIDVSPAMVKAGDDLIKLERLADRVSLRTGDVLRRDGTQLPTAAFDICVSGFLLCHMYSTDELAKLFESVAKALVPGGSTVHIVPHVGGDDDGDAIADGDVKRVEIKMPFDADTDARADTNADARVGADARDDADGRVDADVEGVMVLYDAHWSSDALAAAAAAAGLVDFRFEDACIMPGSELRHANIPCRVSILSAKKPRRKESALTTECALGGVHARLRKQIQRIAVHEGRAPSVCELASCGCCRDEGETRATLRELEQMHAVVLHQAGHMKDEVFIAHPFAFFPTLFQVDYVVDGKRTRVNSPCVWCALGLCAALHRTYAVDADILTCNGGRVDEPIVIPVREGRVAQVCEHWLVHFVVPARFAWDNVVHTCSNMLCFTDERSVARFRQERRMSSGEGDVKTLRATMAMATGWYGHYLDGEDDEWRKLKVSEVKTLFEATGFANPFWKVWDDDDA